ncbi:MAG TPA: hypothetical protein VLL52_04925 [Anaerolineae bacterium]|nr:hypothetical protein [Anaerolineae bacterium]
MEKVVFRSITPVFRFGVGERPFVYEGRLGEARYRIELAKIEAGPAGFAYLMENVPEEVHDRLISIHLAKHTATDVFLIIDVFYPPPYDRFFKQSGSNELGQIERAIFDALRLHTTFGFTYYKTYEVNMFHEQTPLWLSSPLTKPYLFSHFGHQKSMLIEQNHQAVVNTFHQLLEHKWDNDKYTFDRVMQLAMSYHRTLSKLENVEHAFLLLMVILQALFTSKDEEFSSAIGRIKWLNINRREERGKLNPIWENVRDLRNDIAHGDPNYSIQVVKEKYPQVYQQVSKAIIRLWAIKDEIREGDYYDNLKKHIDGKERELKRGGEG